MAVPRVVIIGGGFAGLAAARVLTRGRAASDVSVTLIDRRNHHLFQPLLYQVATATLSPAQIAAPIRKVLSGRANADVLMAEVKGLDLNRRIVQLRDGEVAYDYLIVAAGATHSYFGHEEWEAAAPGLKSIEDAVTIRRRFLMAFEEAEREADTARRRAGLTFVIVGGGPTGVELAGAMVEIARNTIPRDFHVIDTATARIILVEAGERVLAAFPEKLSTRARRDLEELGVEVRVGSRVTAIDAEGVTIHSGAGDERLATRSVVWAAGVAASPLGSMLAGDNPAVLDKSGRVIVTPTLTLPGHPDVFVVGDLAHVVGADGAAVPGVAPAAMQMGRYAAHALLRTVRGDAASRPFAYVNKGNLATIGRARAVAEFPWFTMAGLPAWLLWAGVHIAFLISFRARLGVMTDWIWSYFFYERGARLITGESERDRPPP